MNENNASKFTNSYIFILTQIRKRPSQRCFIWFACSLALLSDARSFNNKRLYKIVTR